MMSIFPFRVDPVGQDATKYMPTRATAGSAGYDVRARLFQGESVRGYSAQNREISTKVGGAGDIVILPGERLAIPLGFKATMPVGVEAQLRPRSGLAFRLGLSLANTPGTIDADFTNEWAALVVNHSEVPCVICDGERIAQVVFAQVLGIGAVTLGPVEQTTERVGGLGSTGVA